ncbi:MAG TPA: HAD-IIIA family hydrolase [Puia sp.]|nr:HAD-IIIA family hydrolase [Puia sp.]
MSFLKSFKHISTFVFDVDGVLTDGTVLAFDNGEQARRMNIKDGYALQLAVKKGYRVLVISGGSSEGVRLRLHKLGITEVFMKVENKRLLLEEYLGKHGLNWKELLFMGDDVPDYAAMQRAGLSCAPADAVSAIRDAAQYISPFKGGEGCVRDVIEKVLKLNDHWELDDTVTSA